MSNPRRQPAQRMASAHGQAGSCGARAALAAFLARQGMTNVHIHCRSGQPGLPRRSGKVQRVIAPLP